MQFIPEGWKEGQKGWKLEKVGMRESRELGINRGRTGEKWRQQMWKTRMRYIEGNYIHRKQIPKRGRRGKQEEKK